MSAATNIDAYAQWLGIPACEQPPHHYRLLGVAVFEADPQAILGAAQRQTALVSAHLGGAAADSARGILAELAAAQACLLDPQQKAAYDRALAWESQHDQVAASTAAGRAAGVVHRPAPRSKAGNSAHTATAAASAAVPSAAQEAEDGSYQPYHEPAAPGSAVPWVLGGVCAGLVGVVVLGLILFTGSSGRPQQAKAKPATNSKDKSNAGDTPKTTRPLDASGEIGSSALPRLPRDADPIAKRLGPPSTDPDNLRWDPSNPDDDPLARVGDPATNPGAGTTTGGTTASGSGESGTSGGSSTDTDKPPEVAIVKNPLSGVPKHAALPRRAARTASAASEGEKPSEPVVLARLDLEDSQNLRLSLPRGTLPGSPGTFSLQPAKRTPADPASPDAAAPQTWEVQYSADGAAPQTVGEYSLADGELSFRWLEEAAEAGAATDPAALYALRNLPLEIAAGEHKATLAQRAPRSIPAVPVKLKTITTSAAIDAPPENARLFLDVEELAAPFPESTWPEGDVIREGKEARVVFGDGSEPYQMSLHFAFEREEDDRVRIDVHPMIRSTTTQKWNYFSSKNAEDELLQLKRGELALDADLARLKQQLRGNPALYQQAAAENNRQAALLQKGVASLEKIRTQWKAIDEAGSVGFRVYANSGGQEIDLLQTQAAPPAAAEPSKPSDPNVGAPLAPDKPPPAADPAADPAAAP
jgi:hypothetical protein